jgi:hypothetical protein
MTEERIKEIEKRCSEATPGPWKFDSYNTIFDKDGREICRIPDHPTDGEYAAEESGPRTAWYHESENNAWFIQHARTDIQELLSVLKEGK